MSRHDLATLYYSDAVKTVMNAVQYDKAGNHTQAKTFYKMAVKKYELAQAVNGIQPMMKSKCEASIAKCMQRISEIESMQPVA